MEAAPQGRSSARTEGSYVDWASIAAGAVSASAISGLLLTFGSGVGLSLVSPETGDRNPSVMTIGILTAAWTILVQLMSYGIGGYLAGRMRRPWADAVPDEQAFRDGVHGLLVWALGVILTAVVVASSAGQAVSTASSVLSGGGANAASGYAVDALLRRTTGQQTPAPRQDEQTRADVRAEVGRLLASAMTQGPQPGGQDANADRTYLAQLIASRTGLSQADAAKRVDEVVTRATAATERARRVGIVAAFLTAAALLVSAAVAWYAASKGGEHREQGTLWRGFGRRPPRST